MVLVFVLLDPRIHECIEHGHRRLEVGVCASGFAVDLAHARALHRVLRVARALAVGVVDHRITSVYAHVQTHGRHHVLARAHGFGVTHGTTGVDRVAHTLDVDHASRIAEARACGVARTSNLGRGSLEEGMCE